MKRNALARVLLFAGVLAAGSAAQAAMDDLSSQPSLAQTQTWYFPDGSNHTVMLTPRTGASGVPDTTVLGAGPAATPVPLPDDTTEEASNVVTRTWFFPDGSNHTEISTAAAR
jgi:hypothetical protein